MIGIGITTRNRPAILSLALAHHMRFYAPSSRIVVIDDASTEPNANANLLAIQSHNQYDRRPISYFYSPRQLGIAKAKNACLWELKGCEHVFLFDDDAMPAEPAWFQTWLQAGLGHLTFAMDVAATKKGSERIGHVTLSGEAGPGWLGFTGCLGCVLYFSKRTLAVLGGYDPRFGVYGYEHCQITHRAHKAKLTPVLYPAPVDVMDSVYTLDMHLGWLGERPPLDPHFHSALFGTSVTPEEAAAHTQYGQLMQDPPIHCKLEDWRL
jgi:glycosyltransferase involved in cell wall biosynthesis